MRNDGGAAIRGELPPGLDRRLALTEREEAITLADFTDEERHALLVDLAEFRASVRGAARGR
jgi:hypothetical protein